MRLNLLLCSLLLTAVATNAPRALASEAPPTAATAVLEDRYPARRVAFAGGVTGLPDLVYAQPTGFRPLTLDVYLPPAGVSRRPAGRPLVLYIHGGGWTSGHTRHSGAFADWPGVLASLAAKGYVVASLNYRLAAEAPFPAAIQDVKAALRWLRERQADYGLDVSRAAVWGGSAGGQLAGLAATSCGLTALEPSEPSVESDCVQAAVLWYPVTDFTPLASNAPLGGGSNVHRYLGCAANAACPAATLQLASPALQVDARTPPMLLVHGEADRVVAASQSMLLDQRLREARVRSELLVIPDVDHSFIGKQAATTRAASLQALERSFAFLDDTIGR
jgi:acetyl esterase/lipase